MLRGQSSTETSLDDPKNVNSISSGTPGHLSEGELKEN